MLSMRPSLRMVHWNSEGFKVGLCSEPPLNQPYSLLCLANNCCIREVFSCVPQGECGRVLQRPSELMHACMVCVCVCVCVCVV